MLRLWSIRAPSHGSPTVSVYNKFKFVRDKNNQNSLICLSTERYLFGSNSYGSGRGLNYKSIEFSLGVGGFLKFTLYSLLFLCCDLHASGGSYR